MQLPRQTAVTVSLLGKIDDGSVIRVVCHASCPRGNWISQFELEISIINELVEEMIFYYTKKLHFSTKKYKYTNLKKSVNV